MSDFDYDLFVIGGGSGGVRAARIAASHGARVALAEESRMGGTCVIRGCVPKKLFVYASQYSEHFEDAAGYGWSVGPTRFDWSTLKANKDREIDRLEQIYTANLERSGVEVFHSRAVFAGPHTLELTADGRRISAARILIATGGRPNIDETLLGKEHVKISDDVFEMETFPERVIVAGGGYIAVEFAGIFAGLGAQTTIVYRGEKLLRGFDEDIRDQLEAEYAKKGIAVIKNTVFERIEKADDGLEVSLTNGDVLHADDVVMAIGRRPYTAGLGLEHAGVATGPGGAILVNAHSRTNQPHIFAVGDVTDRIQLTPVAIREGHAFADTEFGGMDRTVDHTSIATAVFSRPEIGTVGLTEATAREQAANGGEAIDIYKTNFRPMHHILAGRDERMVMKLIVGADTDRVLGVHILGHGAGELAQMLGVFVKMGGTKADLDATVAVHPTAAEEMVTMRTKWTPQG